MFGGVLAMVCRAPSLHFDKATLLGAMDVLNFRETRLLAQDSL
jgi:hypothetical protein